MITQKNDKATVAKVDIQNNIPRSVPETGLFCGLKIRKTDIIANTDAGVVVKAVRLKQQTSIVFSEI